MSRLKQRWVLAAATLAAGFGSLTGVGVVPAAAHPAAFHQNEAAGWCSDDGDTPPCVTSATVTDAQGTTTAIQPADPTWWIDTDPVAQTDPSTGGTDNALRVEVNYEPDAGGDPMSLPASAAKDTFTIHLSMGSVVPRVVVVDGGHLTVKRIPRTASVGHQVTITASPTLQSATHDDCRATATALTCSNQDSSDQVALIEVVDDFGYSDDLAFRNSLYGVDIASNADTFDVPPTVVPDHSGGFYDIAEGIANPYRAANGKVFHGFFEMTLPGAFLEQLGIDDPATVTAKGLKGSIGGAKEIKVSRSGTGLVVNVPKLVFPDSATSTLRSKLGKNGKHGRGQGGERVLRLKRGNVEPGRPHKVDAQRRTDSKATVTAKGSKPHGSKVVGYQMRCESAGHATVVASSGSNGRATVKGLDAATAYRCSSRAKAKARGVFSPWSKPTTLKR